MAGEWANELVIREHEPLDPSMMAEDPIAYAEANPHLVDDHGEEARARIGAWRWKGLFEHRQRIRELLELGAIDFGGYAGPVGYGATVVDFFADTMRAPYDVPHKCKTVFTSHTLEHVPDLACCLTSLAMKIERPGHLIAFVPSCHLVNLRAENWPHHCHTFCMSEEPDTDRRWIAFDRLLAPLGSLELVTTTSDLCLLGIVRI